MRSRNFLVALLLSAFTFASPTWAASPAIRDGSTLQLGNVTYRLDGVEAPAYDQLCIDDHADSWTCGIEVRDQLTGLIAGRGVRCDDLGTDPLSKQRHIGFCSVEGDKTSLNQAMVKLGFALNLEPSVRARFKDDEARAKDDKLGLWKGCFVAPHEFRLGRRDGALLGAACRTDRDREIREALFPVELAQPSGCSIKGKYAVRARVTGNLGIYHLQACPSYPGTTKPDRWFCSEEDAQGAGFRKAYNCRSPKSK
jgi:endonuclease YncB( thermonuclease family)